MLNFSFHIVGFENLHKMQLIECLENVHSVMNRFLLVAYEKGQEIIRPGKISSTLSLTCTVTIFIVNFSLILFKFPPFSEMSLAYFGFFLDYIGMLWTLATTVGILLINYKTFHEITNEILSLNHLNKDLRVYELIITITHSFMWIIMFSWYNINVLKVYKYHTEFVFLFITKIVASTYNYFVLQKFLHHVRILGYTFHNVNSKLENIDFINISLTKNEKWTLKRNVRHLSRFHNSLCNFSLTISQTYSLQILAIIADAVMNVTFHLFFTAYVTQIYERIKMSLHLNLFGIIFTLQVANFYNVSTFIQIVWFCSRTSKEVRFSFMYLF